MSAARIRVLCHMLRGLSLYQMPYLQARTPLPGLYGLPNIETPSILFCWGFKGGVPPWEVCWCLYDFDFLVYPLLKKRNVGRFAAGSQVLTTSYTPCSKKKKCWEEWWWHLGNYILLHPLLKKKEMLGGMVRAFGYLLPPTPPAQKKRNVGGMVVRHFNFYQQCGGQFYCYLMLNIWFEFSEIQELIGGPAP